MIVSVCMASYNGAKYIKKQIDSILVQLDENDEVIISDDSSSDSTLEIVESFNDDRIKLLKNQKFKSPIYNFENAMKHSKGDIIILSDQDDIWENNKVTSIKKYMKNYDLVISDATIINSEGEILETSFYKKNNSKKGFLRNLVHNSYLGCTMAFNRKILNKSLPFPSNIPMHDWWIGMIAEVYGKTFFINEKLIRYRRHGENVSFSGEKSNFSFTTKIRFRMNLLTKLLGRILR